MLCLAYPTIILELKSKNFLERMATKNNILFQQGLFWLNHLIK